MLIDKPLGFSSNQTLSKVKWLFSPIKAGHTGTLDPMATGLLPICLGDATKFSSFLLDSNKTYEAVIKLGYTSDTGDTEGNILKNKNSKLPESLAVKKILKKFVGEIEQLPPMHSALKYKGKALYTYARKGLEVKRNKRVIKIYKLDLMGYKKGILKVSISCSKGTYIRVLAEDIGNALGVGGYLIKLRRTIIGLFRVEDAISLSVIEKLEYSKRLNFLKPVKELLADVKSINLSEQEEIFIKNGQKLIKNNMVAGVYSLFNQSSKFLGVGEVSQNSVLKVKRLISMQDK